MPSLGIVACTVELLLPSPSIAPALLRQASYGTLKIGLYNYFKRVLVANPKGELLQACVSNGVYSVNTVMNRTLDTSY